jgi:uncharacterized membrane protein
MSQHHHPLTLHKGRIEALSDGIFAVVLTLLVLELKVPEMSHAEAAEQLNGALHHLLPTFAGYIITFVVGSLFWYLHHASFQFIKHTTPTLVIANLFFLGFVALLPFTMALFSRYQGLTTPTVFYLGNFVGISLGLTAHVWLATRQHLFLADSPPEELRSLNRRIVTLFLASCAGLVVAFFNPARAIYVFTGLMLAARLYNRITERRAVS